MSEDQPKQPEPQQTSPQTPKKIGGQTRSPGGTGRFFKVQTIRALKATIQALEATVQQLEAEPPERPSPPATLSSQRDTPLEGVVTEAVKKETVPAKVSQKTVASQPSKDFLTQFRDFWLTLIPYTNNVLSKFWEVWLTLLQRIRALLPASVNSNLSDPILSGAVAGILIVVVGTTLTLLPGKRPEVASLPSPIVQQPEPELVRPESKSPEPILPQSTPPESKRPEPIISQSTPPESKISEPVLPQSTPPESKISEPVLPQSTPPESKISEPVLPQSTPPESKISEPIISKSTPPKSTLPKPAPIVESTPLPNLVAPETPEPVEIAPLPTPELTPEQYLIASIQNQVAEITTQFGGGLVKSIQANFLGSLLKVKVGDDWYQLSPDQQDQLAYQMLQQAQNLDFSKLEITNLQGELIARSPVIGSEMIILQRGRFAG